MVTRGTFGSVRAWVKLLIFTPGRDGRSKLSLRSGTNLDIPARQTSTVKQPLPLRTLSRLLTKCVYFEGTLLSVTRRLIRWHSADRYMTSPLSTLERFFATSKNDFALFFFSNGFTKIKYHREFTVCSRNDDHIMTKKNIFSMPYFSTKFNGSVIAT